MQKKLIELTDPEIKKIMRGKSTLDLRNAIYIAFGYKPRDIADWNEVGEGNDFPDRYYSGALWAFGKKDSFSFVEEFPDQNKYLVKKGHIIDWAYRTYGDDKKWEAGIKRVHEAWLEHKASKGKFPDVLTKKCDIAREQMDKAQIAEYVGKREYYLKSKNKKPIVIKTLAEAVFKAYNAKTNDPDKKIPFNTFRTQANRRAVQWLEQAYQQQNPPNDK